MLLTVDLERLDIRPGQLLLDAGCGEGRHCFGSQSRGAHVVGLDLDEVWAAVERDVPVLRKMRLSAERAAISEHRVRSAKRSRDSPSATAASRLASRSVRL